jgi:hypothetical protein
MLTAALYMHNHSHQQQRDPLTVQLAELVAAEALLREQPTHPAHVVYGLAGSASEGSINKSSKQHE